MGLRLLASFFAGLDVTLRSLVMTGGSGLCAGGLLGGASALKSGLFARTLVPVGDDISASSS
jgi:hypothetical protein